MRARRNRPVFWLAACFVGWAMCQTAFAQTPAAATAEVLFRDGREAMKKGDFRAAREDFSESYRLDPSIGTLLNLALCEEKTGQLTAAWLHLRELLERAPDHDERRPLARRRLADLERRIAHVSITLDPAEAPPSGIRLDGTVIGRVSIGVPLPVDPGEHELIVTGAGAERRESLSLTEGQSVVLVAHAPLEEASQARPALAMQAAPAPASETPAREHANGRRTTGIVFAGAGLAAVVASIFPTLAMIRESQEKDDHCGPAGCDQRAFEAAESARTWNVVATTTALTGLLGLGVGSYLFLSSGSSAQPSRGSSVPTTSLGPRLTPGGAGVAVHVTF